jgi:hypothetical protein
MTLALGPATGGKRRYWVRVWAARTLTPRPDDRALDPLVAALADPAWRVREMAAKAPWEDWVGGRG